MDRNFIARHWYASVYEQFENQTHDVEFLLKVLEAHGGILNSVYCTTRKALAVLAFQVSETPSGARSLELLLPKPLHLLINPKTELSP